MVEVSSTVTSKGQVTIPVEIRRILRVSPHDQVTFVVEGDRVELKRKRTVVSRAAGMFKSHEPPLTAEQLREAAADAIAEGAVERMGARWPSPSWTPTSCSAISSTTTRINRLGRPHTSGG